MFPHISISSELLLVPLADIQVSHSLDSRLQFKDEGHDPLDELLSTGSLPVNQKKEMCRYSGVRMKGHKPLSSSKVAPSRASKPGKASVTSSVLKEDRDLQLYNTKTPRRKHKMQASKVGSFFTVFWSTLMLLVLLIGMFSS